MKKITALARPLHHKITFFLTLGFLTLAGFTIYKAFFKETINTRPDFRGAQVERVEFNKVVTQKNWSASLYVETGRNTVVGLRVTRHF